MLTSVKTLWRNEAPFIWAVTKKLAIPTLLAICYGLYDWKSSKGGFEISAYLKVTLPALFFIMWLVSLYERERKKTADRDSFDSLSTGLQSLTDMVRALVRLAPREAAVSDSSVTVDTSYSTRLMADTKAIFASGHKLAALLQAGVAFEHAIRALALRTGHVEPNQMPLHRVLERIGPGLPEGWYGELNMLREIRNRLAHASEQELERLERPEIILEAYGAAIGALNREGLSK
jgi:hypothetical protein